MTESFSIVRRLAAIGAAASLLLAVAKIATGVLAGSSAVLADGIESAGDVLASGLLFLAMTVAGAPPDEDHPYGHGRLETLAGLAVGVLLTATGSGLCVRALIQLGSTSPPPAAWAAWIMAVSVIVKSVLCVTKFRVGHQLQSSALVADAWNDGVDILSGVVALVAVVTAAEFPAADHYGALLVGIIVIVLGIRVVRETMLHLIDTMPDPARLAEIKQVAESVPGARRVEKCYARKTGLQYHVDLHLEVDGHLSVRESHEIAGLVRTRIKHELSWVADVLIHVEPWEPAALR